MGTWVKEERWKERGRRKRKEGGNMREWYSQDGGRTEKESKKRDILIEGAIIGLARNLAPGKFQEIHKNEPN